MVKKLIFIIFKKNGGLLSTKMRASYATMQVTPQLEAVA
jgi:hypothetical protein